MIGTYSATVPVALVAEDPAQTVSRCWMRVVADARQG